MVVRTKPICDVCGNRHTIHEDGFEILDCILYLKNKETETENVKWDTKDCYWWNGLKSKKTK